MVFIVVMERVDLQLSKLDLLDFLFRKTKLKNINTDKTYQVSAVISVPAIKFTAIF